MAATKPIWSPRTADPGKQQEAPYAKDAPIPLPDVVEENSEIAWALWNAACEGVPSWEADTLPMDLREE